MKVKIFQSIYVILLVFLSTNIRAQDSSHVKKSALVKTIWDIPHKTLWEKWMWIHRSITFGITKDQKINYDTAYITSYHKQLVISVPISTRFLQFSLIDFKSGSKLTFAPNLEYDLGISLSSRWASFIVNTGVKVYGGDIDVKGKTKYQDYQLNLYGRKFTTDMFVQYYSGFYIKNSQSYSNYVSDKPFVIRPDVFALNIGVSSYYIVNHRRFSYQNSFSFVERQKKSAGSFLIGLYYSYFNTDGNSTLVDTPFRGSFDTLSLIKNGHTNNFGLNLGYIYTLVFLKKFYVTGSLVQGVGGEQIGYQRDDNSMYHQLVGGAGKLNVRAALGYDSGKYFIGGMGMIDYYLLKGNWNSTFDYSFGKFMIYSGYRFSVLKKERKFLRRLKLIDY